MISPIVELQMKCIVWMNTNDGRFGSKEGQIGPQIGQIRDSSSQMYWNLIWKNPGFVHFGIQSDPLWSQTYHPWWILPPFIWHLIWLLICNDLFEKHENGKVLSLETTKRSTENGNCCLWKTLNVFVVELTLVIYISKITFSWFLFCFVLINFPSFYLKI